MNLYRMHYYSGIIASYEYEDGLEPDYSGMMSFIVVAENEEQAKNIVEENAWSLGGLTFYKADKISIDSPWLVCAVDDKFDEV